MKASLLDVFGNPFVGISISTNDEHTLVPMGLSKEKLKTLENTLKTRIIEIPFDKIGLFSVFGDDFLLVSDMVPEYVIDQIKESIDIDIFVVESDLNVISNTMFYYDDKLLIIDQYSDSLIQSLEKALGVETKPIKTRSEVFAEYFNIVNDRLIISAALPEHDLTTIKSIFGFEDFELVTVNSGSIFLNSGLVKNKYGLVLGKKTTPIEYSRFLNLL